MLINALKLYWRYVDLSLRSQMQYRVSFLMRTSAQFLITFTEFLALVALFHRFGSIRGWSLPQMALFYGMIGIAFAIAEAVPRGFDVFPRLIRSGDFDRMLLRPRATAFQVLGQEFQLMRLGRLTQALFVLIWAISRLSIDWNASKVALLLGAILGGACLFSGLFIIQATICFWTIESIEVVNCTTYGGVEAAQFPLTLYHPWLRRFFTFVVPLATINYFPAHAILGLSDVLGSTRLLQYVSPLAGVLFLVVCLRIWTVGVRHYHSTGS